MKRFLQLMAVLYVSFAILNAHIALAPAQTSSSRSSCDGSQVVSLRPALCDSERLDNSYSETEKAKYTIEVWSASWCSACRTWKRRELPALLKAGYTVEFKTFGVDKVPEKTDKITAVPTVRVYYKGIYLRQETYWRARDVKSFIENRMSLKGASNGNKETTRLL